MALDDILARIQSIDTGAEPPRPECVDPIDTWQVPIGAITLRHYNPIAQQLNAERIENSDVMDAYLPEWADETVACPSCGNGAELTVRGNWGKPCIVACPSCSNEWTIDDQQASTRLLQHAIVMSIKQNGIPAPTRRD